MKQRLLQYLACPSCASTLVLADITESDHDEIMEAQLNCSTCDSKFPVTRGVPRFVPEGLAEDKAATAKSFGWQWQHFTHTDERYAEQFLGWLAPVRPEFFKNKVVLEGGCGKGRHTELAARWGALDVIGVDLSEAVETAFAATRDLENAHIVQADLYHLPFARIFDYAFSVGVLHHLPDPRAGFRSLVSHVKAGGHVSAWVYGAENNEWITRYVDPVRRITSTMDQRLLLQLSKVPTALLYAGTKLVYGPLNRTQAGEKLAQRLFYNDYLNAISSFGWREQHTIVFDHLVAPTSHYLSREEFAAWWREIDATEVDVSWHNKNSWRGFGKV
ncbi:MAG TPA: methyltransferase domain-containing protein [Pyrinomonadaceae bacterium]|nr:methyltransferase domain-containing protein [Pyrinomonadaceae bacterium]